ncbi:hypothetical protein AAZX31_07G194400 [Glycine max]|uniref:uncharacterized protein isoform X2 n=1 Tax=Glycine max TaxID=3847 RepID=UPI001B356C6B|nr:uncharacterized protein LOC100815094 isoform X2 [Glycine max]KAH1243157.1 hypothetical protein GmHk_07G020295 [Glycine max]
MADDLSSFAKDALLVKGLKSSTLVWRLIVLTLAMVSGVYICSICLKQIGTSSKIGFLDIKVVQKPCPEPNIEPWEIPFVHYPHPQTYSRAECACHPVRYFAILSMQRSGSGWFETFLNSHANISSNGEIFSVKGLMQHHEEIAEYFRIHGVSLIFLFRRNLLRRMVSVLANEYDRNAKLLNGTHKSHVHSPKEAEILAKYKPTINSTLLIAQLKQVNETTTKALEYFKSTRHIILYYEDIVKNRTKLRDVQDFLKVPQMDLKSRQVKIHKGSLSSQVENWNDISKALTGTPYESFIHEDYRR